MSLKSWGVTHSFALVDSGYCSEENIRLLRSLNIDFLMRMPAGRNFYKDMIRQCAMRLETPQNAIRYGKRTLFILREETNLYDTPVQAYIILDTQRKAKDLENWANARNPNCKDFDLEDDEFSFLSSGIFILISSKKIETTDILSAYYTRQSVEQIFGFAKSDLDLLPIRCHSEETIRGYLFLQFLLLVIFIEIREKLMKSETKLTVEEAFMNLSNLKCKVYENNIVVQELTKQQKLIFAACSILAPKNHMGI